MEAGGLWFGGELGNRSHKGDLGRDDGIVDFGQGTTYPSFFPSSPTHTESSISLQYILVNDSVLFIVLEYSCIR